MIGYLLPGSDKVQTTAVAGGDAEALLSALGNIENLAGTRSHAGCVLGSMRVCFEAVYDGFWLARFLIDRDIDTSILDPSSFLVSRRGRRGVYSGDRHQLARASVVKRNSGHGTVQLFELALQPVQFIEMAGEEFALCLGHRGLRKPVSSIFSEQMSRVFWHEIGVENGLNPALHSSH